MAGWCLLVEGSWREILPGGSPLPQLIWKRLGDAQHPRLEPGMLPVANQDSLLVALRSVCHLLFDFGESIATGGKESEVVQESRCGVAPSLAFPEAGFHRGSHLGQEDQRESGVTGVTGECDRSGAIPRSWVGVLADK